MCMVTGFDIAWLRMLREPFEWRSTVLLSNILDEFVYLGVG